MRNHTIDYLRGLAMLAMVLIHTSYYFLNNNVALFIWNWSQFAVPLFIYCSSYVFFIKNTPHLLTKKKYISYIFSRLKRLVMPYYLFLVIFIPVIFITSPKTLTLDYFLQSVFLIGGVDINWLPLLMLEVAILLPFIGWMKMTSRIMFVAYTVLALLSSVLFMFVTLSNIHLPLGIAPWKLIMWLPWSLICIAGLLGVTLDKKINMFTNMDAKRLHLGLIFTFLLSTICIYLTEIYIHHDLSMYGNKYPPTLLMISYGIFSILSFSFIFRSTLPPFLHKSLTFMSNNSYSLFFIHYCYLILLAHFLSLQKMQWYLFFILILMLAVATQSAINFARKSFLAT